MLRFAIEMLSEKEKKHLYKKETHKGIDIKQAYYILRQ